jgi:hypothetical protein
MFVKMEALLAVVTPARKDPNELIVKNLRPSPLIFPMEYVIFGCAHLKTYLLSFHRTSLVVVRFITKKLNNTNFK